MSTKRFVVFHIVSEIIIIASVAGYFYRKSCNLESRVAELEGRMETLVQQMRAMNTYVTTATAVNSTCSVPARTVQGHAPPSPIKEVSLDDLIDIDRCESAATDGSDVDLDVVDIDVELESELAELSAAQ